ncbi:MAG: class I SAM-dependent methyltransferase [Candidatus Saccharimonadales bacterium]
MIITVLIIIGVILVLLFASAIAFGAPFLPTLRKRVADAFELLDLAPGQTLLELGSGDGRILRAAAQRGVKSIGYEINPLLVVWSMLINVRYRKLITVRWRNFWHVPLEPADAVYVFLLDPYMKKLDNKIVQEAKNPIKVVSFAFAFPGHKPIKQINGQMLYKMGAAEPKANATAKTSKIKTLRSPANKLP